MQSKGSKKGSSDIVAKKSQWAIEAPKEITIDMQNLPPKSLPFARAIQAKANMEGLAKR